MALLVQYVNKSLGYIPNYELNALVASGRILSFKRAEGNWVDPAIGPMRGCGKPGSYNGPERRARFNNYNPGVQ
ncbi:GSU3473 family protein [Pelotalea chapellei]|uniref:Uncharacterized protein n=1 Tax=Pelotalea chapellei TaxID=44671 RepID=A0ABS5UD47_9BACT|nr:hypothetical protein [Pelotalea chapellei]MBT1073610.1 hypothetical protein [Pelotalea chapellei]